MYLKGIGKHNMQYSGLNEVVHSYGVQALRT
jgi:hypothetical protein